MGLFWSSMISRYTRSAEIVLTAEVLGKTVAKVFHPYEKTASLIAGPTLLFFRTFANHNFTGSPANTSNSIGAAKKEGACFTNA